MAPLSGVTDVAFRRIARRFGAGAVVSEMVASDELCPRRRRGAPAGRGRGDRPACRPARGLRSALDGRGGAARRGQRRGGHRHQHGLPGEEGDGRLCRLGADARSRPGAKADRRGGRGRSGAGHGQDAARLGRGDRINAPELAAPRAKRSASRRSRSTAARASSSTRAAPIGRASPRSCAAVADPGDRQRRRRARSRTPPPACRRPAPAP